MSSIIPTSTSRSLATLALADSSMQLAGTLLRQGGDVVPPAQPADDRWMTSRHHRLEPSDAVAGRLVGILGTPGRIRAIEGAPIGD